ncbi:uncharacterized protein LOC135225026 [Macrobrachium nipponense]|uniref:uncharacterized protein LOC135225026 n=1 Tax=Macrobrachium nipponense TaxID=159736 RepID=UPI0030C7C8E0
MAQNVCFLLVLATALVVILSPCTAQTANISVHFIGSPQFDFFMVPNMTFDIGQAKVVLPGLNSCGCRSACGALKDGCKAWSLTHAVDGTTQCQIAQEGPLTIVPNKSENAEYFFKKSSFPGSYEWPADNLLYLLLDGTFSSQEAKKRCSMIPGHRLFIAKTQATYDYLYSLWSIYPSSPYFIADLVKKNQTEFVWGDGTTDHVTPGKIFRNDVVEFNLFMLILNQLDDAQESHGPFRALCQANPLRTEW